MKNPEYLGSTRRNLQLNKCELCFFSPSKGNTLAGEVRQSSGTTTKGLDKHMVRVAESKERLNIFDRFWNRPRLNYSNFFRIHAETLRENDITDKFNRINIKLTLLEFGI